MTRSFMKVYEGIGGLDYGMDRVPRNWSLTLAIYSFGTLIQYKCTIMSGICSNLGTGRKYIFVELTSLTCE